MSKKEIDPAKKKEYVQTKRQNEARKRQERRAEIEEGRMDERRLAFLVNIYKSLGYTQETFAKKCGISPQLVSWYVSVTDDCNLSRLEQMLAGIGYEVKVELKGPTRKPINERGVSNGVRYTVQGVFAESGVTPTLTEYISDCGPSNRMYFLKEFILSRKMRLIDFAKKCEVDPTCIRYYFIKDDIKVSMIYKIAQANDAEILWTVIPITEG